MLLLVYYATGRLLVGMVQLNNLSSSLWPPVKVCVTAMTCVYPPTPLELIS